METITILTPENIEIKYRLAGVGSRVAAAMVDMLIIFFTILLLFMVILGSFFINTAQEYGTYSAASEFASASGLPIFLVLAFIIYFGYFIISEMTMRGQSIGKRLLKIRVISTNGRPVTFGKSLIRNVLRYFVDMYGVGVAFMFFGGQIKRVGDLAAGTIVVSENSSLIKAESFEPLFLNETGEIDNNIVIENTNKYPMTQEEIELLTDYFNRERTFIDGGRQVLDTACNYFAKKFNIERQYVNEQSLRKLLESNK